MKINEVSLKYAVYSTLYIAVAILVFCFLLFGGPNIDIIKTLFLLGSGNKYFFIGVLYLS